MPPIDYETEYDNRGRVPEHPEIFARWAREAAAYRAAARDAEFGLAYGPSPRQTIDLFPAKDDDDMTPLAMFIHGGWWRSLEPAMFSQMAAGPNARGRDGRGRRLRSLPAGVDRHHHRADARGLPVAVAQAPQTHFSSTAIPPAGIWPPAWWRRIGRRSHPTRPPIWCRRLTRSPACSISRPLVHVSQNQDLRLDEAEARRVSPLHWKVPAGRTLDAVVGALESSEFLRQSKIIAEGWRARGVAARYEEIAGMNHFTIVDALSDADSAMTRRVVELAQCVSAI